MYTYAYIICVHLLYNMCIYNGTGKARVDICDREGVAVPELVDHWRPEHAVGAKQQDLRERQRERERDRNRNRERDLRQSAR